MSTIRLRWNPNPSGEAVTSYRIYKSATSNSYGPEKKYGEVGIMTTPTFILQDAVMELDKALLYFVVSAVNTQGESGYSNEVVVDNRGTGGLPVDKPSAPTGLRVEVT